MLGHVAGVLDLTDGRGRHDTGFFFVFFFVKLAREGAVRVGCLSPDPQLLNRYIRRSVTHSVSRLGLAA